MQTFDVRRCRHWSGPRLALIFSSLSIKLASLRSPLFPTPVHLKAILSGLILLVVIGTIVADFTPKPEFPAFMSYIPDLFSEQVHFGQKAVIFATCGVASLFISCIPTCRSEKGWYADLLTKLVGATAASAAAWFWLMDQESGSPTPYRLIVLVPVVLMVVAIFYRVFLDYEED